MSNFISYAQNYEDVMLWRALKHVESGFYIDVGANDPEVDSVTKAFYDAGWRGINIEPIPQWFKKLENTRIRDINLQLAVGRATGEITLFEIPDTGLSTADKTFAERHALEHGFNSHEFKVPMDTLTNLCEQYHTAPIHFLKIDVEGMEKAVLQGIDFNKLRPWIVLLESMLPNVQEESYSEWEYILLNARYKYAYCDGINRFYLAEEHAELLGAFKYPPNVFDSFQLKREKNALIQALDAEKKVQESDARLVEAMAKEKELQKKLEHLQTNSQWQKNELEVAEAKIEELNHSSHHWETVANEIYFELNSVYRSKAWRVTWPVRKLMQVIKSGFYFFLVLLKKTIKHILAKTITFVHRHERVKEYAIKSLSRCPKLEARLREFSIARGLISDEKYGPHRIGENGNADPTLTPRGRVIYIDLQSALKSKKEEKL